MLARADRQTDAISFIKRKDSASAPGRANAGPAMGHPTGSRPGQARPAHSFTGIHSARPLLRLLSKLNFKEPRGHQMLPHTHSLLEMSFQIGQAARLPCSNTGGSFTSKCTRHWLMTHGCRRQPSKSRVLGLRRLREKDLEPKAAFKDSLGYSARPCLKAKDNKKYRSVAQW